MFDSLKVTHFFRILHWNYVNATFLLCPSTTSWSCIRGMDMKVNVWICTYPISRSNCFYPSRGVEGKREYVFCRCFQNVCFNSKGRIKWECGKLIADYYHPCVYVRREASEFVSWFYQVTAWTAEESPTSLNSQKEIEIFGQTLVLEEGNKILLWCYSYATM